jgi:hypothetical protein
MTTFRTMITADAAKGTVTSAPSTPPSVPPATTALTTSLSDVEPRLGIDLNDDETERVVEFEQELVVVADEVQET